MVNTMYSLQQQKNKAKIIKNYKKITLLFQKLTTCKKLDSYMPNSLPKWKCMLLSQLRNVKYFHPFLRSSET